MKKSILWRSVLVLALCIAGTANGMAQDLKSILSGVANAVANKVTGESASLTSGSKIELPNFLSEPKKRLNFVGLCGSGL